jgi:16S rRNA (guanine966-N2)-methyltransferase
MDMMRESLFSILGSLDGCSFLDLFSGSGSVGIEAASRKAEPVHLVEKDRGKRSVILQNIAMVESEITLFVTDIYRFIPTARIRYDVVYADPPFPMGGKASIAKAVDRASILTEGGLFIIHYPGEEHEQLPQVIGALEAYDERSYGRSKLRFYRNTRSIGESDVQQPGND